MADELPFESKTPEERRADRDKQKRMVLILDKSSQVTAFLAEMADSVLDSQHREEDLVLLLKTVILPDTATAASKAALPRALAAARRNRQELAADFSKLIMAARYDCSSVNQAMLGEEGLEGISAAQVKAIREAYTKGRSNFRGQRSSGERSSFQRQSDALSAATQNLAAVQLAPRQLPTPVSAAPDAGKYRFPCTACNVRGHWKNEGKCRPEDLQANIAAIVAMMPSKPASGAGTGTTGKEFD